jgi:N-acetylneuraminic acid mutarotase
VTGAPCCSCVSAGFWVWDQANNSWTREPDFPGAARWAAAGFVIGHKAYIGTGLDETNTALQDLWEWDQPSGTWTQKANYPAEGRYHAAGFSIFNKGYIGTGMSFFPSTGDPGTDFYEWDQASDTWSSCSFLNMPTITSRCCAVGFSLGSAGYLCTGNGPGNLMYNDAWYWDPVNLWSQGNNFSGSARYGAVAFTIGNKGYIGTGWGQGYQKDLWEYDPSAVGLNESSSDGANVTLFPNPVSGELNIQFSGIKIKSWRITDLNGKLIREANGVQETIKINGLDDLPAGTYFIDLLHKNGTISKKFLKQ